jgi:hypothetical protein
MDLTGRVCDLNSTGLGLGAEAVTNSCCVLKPTLVVAMYSPSTCYQLTHPVSTYTVQWK